VHPVIPAAILATNIATNAAANPPANATANTAGIIANNTTNAAGAQTNVVQTQEKRWSLTSADAS
jgi:hypothetical protein